jgi:hypothetical protein
MSMETRQVYVYVWVWCKSLPQEIEDFVKQDGSMNVLKDGLRSISSQVADGHREPRFTLVVFHTSNTEDRSRASRLSELVGRLLKEGKVYHHAVRFI